MKAEIQKALDDFTAIIKDAKLEVSKSYYPYRKPPEKCEYKDEAGVYIFISGNGEPIYVGKCEEKLGDRIWRYLGSHPSGKIQSEPPQDAVGWVRKEGSDISIITIRVPKSIYWLAPAIEGFLIDKYKKSLVHQRVKKKSS